MAKTFRAAFKWLLPSWLKEGEGGLVAYSLATLKDIYLERVYQGLVARFPSYAADDALAEIGRERGLKQGRSSRDAYVSRLQQWRYPATHKVRGSAFAALREISAQFAAWCRTIDTKGNEHIHTAAGVESYAYQQRWTWDAAGTPSAVHDPNAGSDPAGGYLELVAGSGLMTLHCDGTPGTLVFVHLSAGLAGAGGAVADYFSLPTGWTQLVSHTYYHAGSSTSYHQEIWYRLVGATDDPFTTVPVTCVRVDDPGMFHDFVGRAVNVHSDSFFSASPVYAFAVSESAISDNYFPTPLRGGHTRLLFFASGQNTTYTFTGINGAINQMDAARVVSGIGIAEATAAMDYTDNHDVTLDTASVTLGSNSALLTTWVAIVEQPPVKARFWVELRGVAGAASNTYSGSGTLWTDPNGNETLGIAGMTPREASDLRDLFNVAPVWRPAGTRAEWAIINLTGDPVTPQPSWQNWSAPNRDGSSDATQLPTRNPAFRYISLYGARAYAGNPVWTRYGVLLNGSTYEGDPNSILAPGSAATLPVSGAAYVGNPASFPVSARLPDDGDFPE